MGDTEKPESLARGEHVTEDEAALYDRQIRLWGLEAQTRIRKAHILVLNLDGLTTEAIKNWVLAGIARLTLVDARDKVEEHDLSAGFFWRHEDLGGERLGPAAARIQALNPLVHIDVLPSSALGEILDPSSSRLNALAPNVVVLGIPSGPAGLDAKWSKSSLCALNDACRKQGVPFYATGSQGLGGWAFSDLGEAHEYVVERPDVNAALPKTTVEGALHNGTGNGTRKASAAGKSNGDVQPPPAPSTSGKRLEKRRQDFVPLKVASEYSWSGLSRSQLRRVRPVPGLVSQLALWKISESKPGQLVSPAELSAAMREVINVRGLDEALLMARQGEDTSLDDFAKDFVETALRHPGELSPVCAMLGGVVSQDVLNALGGREEPFVNWFQLEGLQGAGPVFALGTPAHVVE